MTKDEMVGWHHRLDGHEFEQAPRDGEGQGSLMCCSPWGHKESDTTERLNDEQQRGPSFHFTLVLTNYGAGLGCRGKMLPGVWQCSTFRGCMTVLLP